MMVVENDLTVEMVSAASLKQGFLHIKRERSSSPVATRVLFKPWQQAYFILRQNPYILEEYKDASLKTQKQIHFIGTVKYVGKIRTSKSKQYAFEVVIQEKTPLLLACDNEILLDEWIDAFTDVMKDMQRRKTSGSTSIYNIERQDTFDVEVLETSLSEANDLHGDYILSLSATRILLMEPHNHDEVLSWPLTHMTFYKSQPSLKRVIFAMGRNCHFGCGKLVFETKFSEKIISFIHTYFNKKGIRSREESSSTTSTNSSSHSGSMKLSTKSSTDLSSFEESLDRPVFESPTQERKPSQSTECGELHDFSTAEENNNINTTINIEKVDSSSETIVNHDKKIDFAEITNEDSYILPNESKIDERWRITHSNFSRFSRERAHVSSTTRSRQNSDNDNEATTYLQIVEEDEVITTTQSPPAISSVSKSSDIGNEHDMEKILKSITSSLENPMQHENILANFNIQKKSKTTPAEIRRSSEPWKKVHSTDSIDKNCSKSKLIRTKGTHSCESSGSSNIVDHIRSSAASFSEFPGIPSINQSPNSSPKLFRQHEESFPKQHSISNKKHNKTGFTSAESHFTPARNNPFSKAESFLTRPLPQSHSSSTLHSLHHKRKTGVLSLRRNQTLPTLPTSKSPELNRNTKPKANNTQDNESTTDMLDSYVSSPHSSIVSGPDQIKECDEPPPIPERTSPQNLRSPHHKLTRTENISDEIEILSNTRKTSDKSNCSSRKSSYEHSDRKTSYEHTDASPKTSATVSASEDSELVAVTTKSNMLAPPPLPPKVKLLSSTRSAPLSSSLEESESPPPLRRLSFSNPKQEFNSREDITTVSKDNSVSTESNIKDIPPEVPSRDYQLKMVQRYSTSEGNLLKIQSSFDTPPITPPRTPPRTHSPSHSPNHSISHSLSHSSSSIPIDILSQSLDSSQIHHLLSVKVTNYEVKENFVQKKRSTTLTEYDESTLLPAAISIPKTLKSGMLSSNFPKSPKTFF